MPQMISGVVERGDARGRELGFPTANLSGDFPAELEGIWAACAVVDGAGSFLATVSIGRRPTYYPDTAMRLAEVHLHDFNGDIYGRHVRVELQSFLRHQVRCRSEAELIHLIADDVRSTRQALIPAPDGIEAAGLLSLHGQVPDGLPLNPRRSSAAGKLLRS